MRSERYFHPEFGWLAPTSPAANDLPPHGLVPPYRRKALDGIGERRILYRRPTKPVPPPCLPMPKSGGRKPKKRRAPASAQKKRLDNLNATPQELPLSTQAPQEPPPLATAPSQEQSTQKIKKIAKLTTAVVLAAIAIVLCAYAFILTNQ